MAVALKTLIEITPFDTQTRSQLLEKLDTLSEDQKYRLSSTCWTSLAIKFQAQFKARTGKLLLEIQQGVKKYNKEDFQKIENDLYQEFAGLLQSAQSGEEMQGVREELNKYMPKPSIQPPQNPQPQDNPNQQ